MDRRNQWQIWTDAAYRFLLSNTLSNALPIYVVTEYPKSGGTWVGQMLAAYFDIPFPRNRVPPLASAVHHAHYLHSPLLGNAVCVMRDGRDIMVSYYYHLLFENDKSSPIVVARTRRDLSFTDYDDVKSNMVRFIAYLFDRQLRSRSPFQFTWPQFVRSWVDTETPIVKYEDLVDDGVSSLSNLIMALTGQRPDPAAVEDIVTRYSFAAQANRPPGVEQKGRFLRKGQPGDWRNKFDYRAAELFAELAQTELEQLGYETDKRWVGDVA